ncbi:MAG: DUF4159 domain-containing protein [Mesorhizobium sp.]|nr:DUF4159 domain-containing protein [Mesorhizobium sp.]
MSWLPLSFGFPAVLVGLLALPIIWWLLRLTPPKPRSELFPPLKILARVLRKEETPHQSPWWLTLLRLLMAALIVFALAEPVFNPRERVEAGGGALALVVDNGWASASDWPLRVATAERLIADANASGTPVVLAFTAEPASVEIGPFEARAALDRLRAAKPRPVPVDRPGAYARVATALEGAANATIAVLSDGLAADGDRTAFETLLAGTTARLVWAVPDWLAVAGLTAVENTPTAFTISAVRPSSDVAPRQLTAGAFDDRGRRIADAQLSFGPGEMTATADVNVPFELRNDFASVAIDGEAQAGAVRVLDENSKRRRIGLLSQSEADQAQPLLSPLYYIRRALEPYADLVEPATPDLAAAIPELLAQKPAMIVMADIGTLPDTAHQQLVEWIDEGGTLVRFAGSRLAAAGADDELLPVRLRLGERALGGALSWTEPQPVTDFPDTGPFAGLTPPREVSVSRQVLAEPSPDIVEHTWAGLADGTPLVTGATRGKGTLVLFHVTPEATWSNLPISGSFVEMLRRIVQLSRNQGRLDAAAGGPAGALPPYRIIGADGGITTPGPEARPLEAGIAVPAITVEHPPGLYGSEEGVVALNLLAADAVLEPLARPRTSLPTTTLSYALDESRDLKGPLVAAALALMVLDTLAVFWMGGLFARRPRPAMRAATAGAAALLAIALSLSFVGDGRASDARPGDAEAIAAISRTRVAYVLTGDPGIDAVTRAGIEGLRRFLVDKTALEPGEPAGVDIAVDELSFYPLIYWPIDPESAMPTEAVIARVDAYMQQGGTVLFDTRDQFSTGLDFSGSASPATQRLRDILGDLNVPALEPVPDDHVLTKSFFIMQDFPGRFTGSPLWVEASAPSQDGDDRPVRTGDGVSPIIITANDLAGAWAIDQSGDPLLPTVPNDPMQRVYAMRGGVNIMMYMLTGNYKSDQVHVPVLLERLGQ